MNRKPLVRMAVRKWARQGKLTREQARAVLNNEDIQEAVAAEADHLRAEEEQFGSLIDFLTWLLDNSDRLIAFIEKLIQLFTVEDAAEG